jgi:hypothetical protein
VRELGIGAEVVGTFVVRLLCRIPENENRRQNKGLSTNRSSRMMSLSSQQNYAEDRFGL